MAVLGRRGSQSDEKLPQGFLGLLHPVSPHAGNRGHSAVQYTKDRSVGLVHCIVWLSHSATVETLSGLLQERLLD